VQHDGETPPPGESGPSWNPPIEPAPPFRQGPFPAGPSAGQLYPPGAGQPYPPGPDQAGAPYPAREGQPYEPGPGQPYEPGPGQPYEPGPGQPYEPGPPRRRGAGVAGVIGAVVVIAIIGVLALIGGSAHSSSQSGSSKLPNTKQSLNGSAPTILAPSGLVTELAQVSASSFAAAGVPPVSQISGSLVRLNAPSRLTAGKAGIFYVGAGYCPYCGAFRWPFAIALMRFGSFRGLDQSASSPWDQYPSTPTLSFIDAAYSSPFISLSTTETESNVCSSLLAGQCFSGYSALQQPSAAAEHVFATYDTPAYFPAAAQAGGSGGWIPFVYFAGKYVEAGTLYSPQVLAGHTPAQVAAALSTKSQLGQAILQVANIYTAAICSVDGGRPGAVCNSPVIRSAEALLPKS
jgi:hypothetical protein